MLSLSKAACVALLLVLGDLSPGTAQTLSPNQPAAATLGWVTSQDTIARQNSPGAGLPHRERKVTRPLGELEPVVEWQWGAILATALAMIGAILLTLPVALAYKWTKPPHESDPSVMHSSIILAPTIAGILIVIQGSLAMAFSLAGVATAVRFRNSLKDTNDAVYVFVAVAIGLAAGVQALDIALAISLIFSAMVVLLSRSPFRNTGTTHQPGPAHHHHHPGELNGTALKGGGESGAPSTQQGSPLAEYLTVQARDPEPVRAPVEQLLHRQTKRWQLEKVTSGTNGITTLLYAVRCRKRAPLDQILGELRALAQVHGFTVVATPASVPDTAAVRGDG
jgi:uncharacterized protein DUF4956